MSRLGATFERLRREKKKALVAYLCMGDPSLEASIDLAVACAEAGADILELGVPFSDPTADGPVIARAGQRAIAGGVTIAKILDAAAAIRARTEAPLVVMTYYNPVLVTGQARVLAAAAAAGVDALLVVDLPLEEGADLREAARRSGIAIVPLIAPTTEPARVDAIAAAAREGEPTFLYVVSMTGVTGAHAADLRSARDRAHAISLGSGLPVVIGFGIDSPGGARAAAGAFGEGPDGIVVGSAIVRRVEEAAASESVRAFVRDLRAGLDVTSRA